ncbi:tetratricopeptide repeat protein [Methanosphaerula palustris]|uniref:Tetratricopeptide TPR_2 repeat protein n=1 Tax=Methanosphaerula palustris (strain ATCC BAA-1556 / DSM 19958 / E1-9c) TaxID=521011 RepID=B8GIG6_METPE|nr:tetratricopeptide repeat protein [Methanosphaerula palustris]ACL15517.1 Tetratricopeptide TPR_2 repeat protein [Methanosphaerula palustris E1-9c]
MRIAGGAIICLVITGLLLVSPAVAAETAQDYFDQGIVFDDRGQHERALEAYEQGLTIEPTNAHLWGAKGRTLLILGRYQESADAYNRSVRLDPSQEYARKGEQDALDKISGVSNATPERTTTPAAGFPWWIAILLITGAAAIAARGRRR